MRSFRGLAIVLAIVLSVGGRLFAADTGTVSGLVFDQGGQPARRRHRQDFRRPPAGRTHGANRQQRRLQFPGAAPRPIHRRSHANRRCHRLPGRHRRGRQGHTGRSRDRHVVKEDVQVSAAAPTVDLGRPRSTSTTPPRRSIAAARAHLRRPVPADSRRRRERLVRARRRRQPAGQHLSDRRRQHHQPGLRVALHRGQRVRHRRIQREARGHQRGVRALVRLRRQRRDEAARTAAGGLRFEAIPTAWIASRTISSSNHQPATSRPARSAGRS